MKRFATAFAAALIAGAAQADPTVGITKSMPQVTVHTERSGSFEQDYWRVGAHLAPVSGILHPADEPGPGRVDNRGA